jgi:hypothetical protein
VLLDIDARGGSLLDQPFPEFRSDANGRIFRRLAWEPALVHHSPPNDGLPPDWRKHLTRGGHNSSERYYDLNWEITLQ